MTFAGFPEAALDFYEGLEADNTKAYWTDHKDVYERAVKEPMRALLAALEPEFGPAKFFRPYNDVRFRKDKTLYKTQASAAAEHDGQALYLELSPRGLFLAGGMYQASTDQARRLRAAIADDRPGRALVRLLDRLGAHGFAVDGERLKRVPKEHAEAGRQNLLTVKTLVASRQHAPAAWLHEPEAAERIAAGWREVKPLNAWLARHVGPPRPVTQT